MPRFDGPLTSTPKRPSPCRYCKDKGLIRMRDPKGAPDDIAVCDCRAGLWYRQAGVAAVRRRLKLTDDRIRVAWREDFIDAPVKDADKAYIDGLMR